VLQDAAIAIGGGGSISQGSGKCGGCVRCISYRSQCFSIGRGGVGHGCGDFGDCGSSISNRGCDPGDRGCGISHRSHSLSIGRGGVGNRGGDLSDGGGKRLLVHDGVESVVRVGGVLDCTTGAVGIHQAVAALDDVTVAGFMLALGVAGQVVLDVVSVTILGVGVVVCVDGHGGGDLSDGWGCISHRSS
jgi:hypothetical protein